MCTSNSKVMRTQRNRGDLGRAHRLSNSETDSVRQIKVLLKQERREWFQLVLIS